MRISGIYHKLRANGSDFDNPIPDIQNASFTASFVDMAAVYEFNFTPYKTSNRKNNQSFYTSVGLGYQLALSGGSQITIPFSMGYKFNVGKKLSAGLEISSRKTFFDKKIDGIMNYEMEEKFHLVGNNDWYTFAGIFMSYKIFNYREDCPAYD